MPTPLSTRPELLAGALCAPYAIAHAWWAATGPPGFLAGGESPLPGGWLPVVPAVLAAAVCLPGAPSRTRAVVAVLGGAGLVAYCMLAWIDAVMLLMVPFGLPFPPAQAAVAAVRVGGALGGALAVFAGLRQLRDLGWTLPPVRSARTPAWGWVAALCAVAGLAARLVPEVPRWLERGVVGPGGAGFVLFVVLMVLAGTALPLALVVPAGRRPPRWLLLGPALFVGAGLTAYFGLGGVGAILTGAVPAEPEAFLMIGGYALWGVALLVAAASYARTTAFARAQRE